MCPQGLYRTFSSQALIPLNNRALDLANKNGIKSKILDMVDYEDFAFGLLIEEGKQSDFIDKDNFINNLKNDTKN
jgi:hypothetical protein